MRAPAQRREIFAAGETIAVAPRHNVIMRIRITLWIAALLLCFAASAAPLHAAELRVSAKAMEKTLADNLFTAPDKDGKPGRYYIRGGADKPCSVYAEAPHISFKQDRIWVHVRIHARLGTAVGGDCLGITVSTETDVSLIPYAERESIGFKDARIERATKSAELNFLLSPFLKGKLPAGMEVNAAELIRKTLAGSLQRTGYDISLDRFEIGTLEIRDDLLVIDVDADVTVR